ncbi:MAG: hypothetical protein PS018_02435 [bacterium]|nr:hypothetical protein [bacterium]
MNWFRKHIKTGSRLALFALAVQFALSFGHFHGVAAQAAPALQNSFTGADLVAIATTLAAQEAAPEAALPPRPADHDTDHQRPDCAVCAVLSLANNFLFASPPLLDLPRAIELLYLTTDAEFAHLGSLHWAFRSRAPPAS